MATLLVFARRLDALVSVTGRLSAWLLLALVGITVFDVITRRYFAGSSIAVQEMEWHLHTAIFALCLGYAYLRHAHVRIEIVRERLNSRIRAFIELLGCLFFLIPYTAILVYFAVEFTWASYTMGEGSSSPSGLCCRWVIKSVLTFGIALLLLSGVAVLLRHVVALWSPDAALRARAETDQG